jgi:hypothetical protein
LNFPFFERLKLTVDFKGGAITSDAGLVFIREEDERQGLCESVCAVMSDPRDHRYIDHELLDLVRQRAYQIVAGYEECNDADDLRKDPLFKAVAADRKPDDADLASQPTLSRFENQPDEYELERIMEVFVDKYLTRRPTPPDYIILDIDPTDDPCHGAQQMALFHGYYDEKIYHQLLIFDGDTGELIVPVLRPGSVHGADGVIEVLDWLLPRLRSAWPETEIIVRADGGLASPRLYEFLEARGIWYVIGLITNNRLRDHNAGAMKTARSILEAAGVREQVFCAFDYQAGSWTISRRVIGKAELLNKGPNQRFVVTNVHEACPLAVYHFYRQRGEDAENRIKEFKNMIHADRLSCHDFFANWFRLLLHAIAYELIRGLREHLAGTEYEKSTMDTIRLKLIKVGARVEATARRLWLHCTTGYPYQQIWINLHARLCAG